MCVTISAIERYLKNSSPWQVRLRAFLKQYLLWIVYLPSIICGIYTLIASGNLTLLFGKTKYIECQKPIPELEFLKSSIVLPVFTIAVSTVLPFVSSIICYPI